MEHRKPRSYVQISEAYIARTSAAVLKTGSMKSVHVTDRSGMTAVFDPTRAGTVNVRFYLRHYANGRQRSYPLGRYPFISIDEARNKFITLKQKLITGEPTPELKHTQRQEQEKTIGSVWAEFSKTHYEGLSSGTRDTYDCLYTRYLEPHADMPLSQINVQWVSETYLGDKYTPIIRNVLSILRMMIAWANAMGYIPHDPLTSLKVVMPKRAQQHQPSFKYETMESELKELLQKSFDEDKTAFTGILGYLFTLLRRAELLDIVPSSIYEDAGMQYVLLKTKTWKEFKVPFTRQMRTLAKWLLDRNPGTTRLFYKIDGTKVNRPYGEAYVTRYLKASGWDNRICVHGFRTCGRQWLAQQKDVKDSVAELCLAHRVGTATEQAYNRGDYVQERLKALQLWCDFVESCLPYPTLEETLARI